MSRSHIISLSALAHTQHDKTKNKRDRDHVQISPSAVCSPAPPPIEITLSHRKTFLMLVGLSPTVLQFFKQEIAIGDCSRIASSTFVGA